MSSPKATSKPQFPVCEGQQYPCPCRRQANLVPIYLTDAFGCDRCPQVFVMNDEGCLVEQLTGGYPYARAWRWTGQQWKILQPGGESNIAVFFALLFLWVLGWFVAVQRLDGPYQWLYWISGVLVMTFVLPIIQSRFHHRR